MAMRATQKKRMSNPVTSTEVGKYARSSGVSSGHPIVEKGHRPEENHVSSTSGSWRTAPPQLGHAARSVRETWTVSQRSQYQAGILGPHQSWREMHQGRVVSIQW